jgi:hypothetical protein
MTAFYFLGIRKAWFRIPPTAKCLSKWEYREQIFASLLELL